LSVASKSSGDDLISSRSAPQSVPVPAATASSKTSRRDIAVIILLVFLGIAPRLAFVSIFPTIPVSDFRSLVAFGLHLKDHGLMAPGWFWEYLNQGLPMCLSVLFRSAPSAQPDALSRTATAIVCGQRRRHGAL
jgi:hypothetical protein